MVVVLSLACPIPMARISSSTKASAKCMNEPATMTIARCQAGLLRIERGSSAGSTSSSVVMPVIRTNAPNGRALTPYSVSPRVVDHRVGPKPTKNWVAFMPNFLAVRKCPASCKITEMRMPTTNRTMPKAKAMLCRASRKSATRIAAATSRPRHRSQRPRTTAPGP